MEKLYLKYESWKYKNTFYLLLGLLALFYFINTNFGQEIINKISKLGYVGSFIAGICFVSTFTVAPAGLILFKLAQIYDPFFITITAGIGATIGDYIIFRFIKDKIFIELEPIFMKLGGSYLSNLLSTPYFSWLAMLIGAFIVASPLPDEVGISLMGLSKLKNWQFIGISFVLDTAGILFIVLIANII